MVYSSPLDLSQGIAFIQHGEPKNLDILSPPTENTIESNSKKIPACPHSLFELIQIKKREKIKLHLRDLVLYNASV